jgi:hypothetical protein
LLLQKRYTRFGEEKAFRKRQRFLQIAGATSVVTSIIILLIVLYQGVDPKGWCSWCTYINCIPIQNLWNCDDTGCSDGGVVGLPFPNSTMQVTCPSSTNGKVVYTRLNHAPTSQDVIAACQALCFT